jgi:hypothetical protein
MKPNEHSLYDSMLNVAAQYALDNKGRCYSVLWDGKSFSVRASERDGIENLKVVCIAQHWAGDEVQLRFTGAYSEWRKP